MPPAWSRRLDATTLGDKMPVPPCGSCLRVLVSHAGTPRGKSISGTAVSRLAVLVPMAGCPWDPWSGAARQRGLQKQGYMREGWIWEPPEMGLLQEPEEGF